MKSSSKKEGVQDHTLEYFKFQPCSANEKTAREAKKKKVASIVSWNPGKTKCFKRMKGQPYQIFLKG